MAGGMAGGMAGWLSGRDAALEDCEPGAGCAALGGAAGGVSSGAVPVSVRGISSGIAC
jgi:hypothetical protein